MKNFPVHKIQNFHVRLNRGHGEAHTRIYRDPSNGEIIRMQAPGCVNSKCELNLGSKHPQAERHFK